ncbi:hypothetical protein C5167_012226 [Papaver somniferum]|uniref:THO complex subunitTHOC2 C-terminal domain-containing protein n=1 Tax=Papaver somniferum TaxID=3469 RepID=A0A4Y7J028_PAPSO|nr:hypothetical protein C5167_012226 [Papaver somniferum]
MPDAVYCAQFVRTLHSLGTPFFNTVNHIDVLICKTLQPMICCCTEYEAGRLGRFLFETLEMAYQWKKKESTFERECGNMPGFAVYYRYPNSQRVTYSQFVRVHWKWSCRITRLLIQCLESNEYMEIRNALIMLTKISSVFPVTRKSGINLEKRVAKIKGDEREDLKVLATGVAAALASRKSLRVTDKEFCMGYVDLKPASITASNGSSLKAPQMESSGMKNSKIASQLNDSGNFSKDPTLRARPIDGRMDRTESITVPKSDPEQPKLKGGSLTNGLEIQSANLSSFPEESVTGSKSMDKQQKRTIPSEELDRLSRRRKDSNVRDGIDDQGLTRATEKLLDRPKQKGSERYDRDHRERLERPDRSMERHGRERSTERVHDMNFDRIEKLKDDRSKLHYSESPLEKSRFNRQSLPPLPPLPSHMVAQSVSGGSRRDEDADRRVSNTRHMQRLSPRHEEKDRRREEDMNAASKKRRFHR